MPDAHRRQKNPQQVRQQVLTVAAHLCVTDGPGGLTLDAVSKAAGISKGGLLHHFPGRTALLDAVFDDLVGRFDTAIETGMSRDSIAEGRFTRAYLAGVFDPATGNEAEGWQALTAAILSEPHLRARWRLWVQEKAERHAATDDAPRYHLVRFAADGLWLADLLGSHDLDPRTRASILDELRRMSAPDTAPTGEPR